jgi:hypothetical protein
VRVAQAPLHVVIGGLLVWRFVDGARTPMVLLLGLAFAGFGGYRLWQIKRALDGERR